MFFFSCCSPHINFLFNSANLSSSGTKTHLDHHERGSNPFRKQFDEIQRFFFDATVFFEVWQVVERSTIKKQNKKNRKKRRTTSASAKVHQRRRRRQSDAEDRTWDVATRSNENKRAQETKESSRNGEQHQQRGGGVARDAICKLPSRELPCRVIRFLLANPSRPFVPPRPLLCK